MWRSMEWLHGSLLPLWLEVSALFCLSYTKDLRDCVTHRTRCVTSSSLEPHVISCSERGKLPHPNGMSNMFLLCKGSEYSACQCECPPNKHFSVELRTCTRHNISLLASTYPRGKRPKDQLSNGPFFPTSKSDVEKSIIKSNLFPLYNLSSFDINNKNTNNNNKLVESYKSSTTKTSHKPHKEANEIHKSNSTNRVHLKTLTEEVGHTGGVVGPSQQVAPPALEMLEDNAVFPAWAIALVVLCLVILFVLVILIFY